MRVFMPGPTNAIVGGAVTQVRALPGGGDNAVFYNDGPTVAFVITGESTLVVTLPALSGVIGAAGNATPVPVGTSVPLAVRASHTHWGVITPGGVANVYCTTGDGE